MKGFPNQIAELPKVTRGIKTLIDLVDAGENPKADTVFGPALVRSGVAGTGHTPKPVEEYLADQFAKERNRQSFGATARGLRELYRLAGFIDDSGPAIIVKNLGRQAATFADAPMTEEQVRFWRRVLREMTHTDGRGRSHPYQMLLRLVARRPGISRAKCALALEAINDSDKELQRLANLSDLPEQEIIARIGVTASNWNNAKKVLPKFAEQLGDVIRKDFRTIPKVHPIYFIADAPGRAEEGPAEAPDRTELSRASGGARAPRSAREVTPETIGIAGIAESEHPEFDRPAELDPARAAETLQQRADRLRRHNLLVRAFATRLSQVSARIFEGAFDILGLLAEFGILTEVKTLDGTLADEVDRVREALSQLLYYEAFVTRPVANAVPIRKVALFERQISAAHRKFLNTHSIASIWKKDDTFAGDKLAAAYLGRHLNEFA